MIKLLSHNLTLPILLVIAISVIIIAIKKNRTSKKALSSQVSVIEDWKDVLVEKPEYENIKTGNHILFFHNYQCPFCKSVNSKIEKLKEEYDFNVSYYNRVFANDENIIKSSLAVECAKEQNIFQDYKNLLYDNFANLGETDFTKLAYQSGIQDTSKFRICLENQEKLPILHRDTRIADSLGITEVPTLIINGKMITGVANSELLEYLLSIN
ncbi:DsbA family protein [Gracilimonas sp.]|uniref:DsbA family protein n=1 Tax=Gracilimonas sp. TaxID=1974203 RepID=UPI0028722CFC|nr:thioredoxin domain-containing protein [Gracilimonas sp.]